MRDCCSRGRLLVPYCISLNYVQACSIIAMYTGLKTRDTTTTGYTNERFAALRTQINYEHRYKKCVLRYTYKGTFTPPYVHISWSLFSSINILLCTLCIPEKQIAVARYVYYHSRSYSSIG